MSVQIAICEGKDGMDVAEAIFAGQSYTATSRNGATMKLARLLVAAGCPDQPIEARFADGRLRFTARSLHRLAELTIEEGDRGIRHRRWKPVPMGGDAGQDSADDQDRAKQAPALAAAQGSCPTLEDFIASQVACLGLPPAEFDALPANTKGG